ncbi:hypothetical protein [Diaphorobacter sp. ED-3]|uniref:hypothetical protein n=1 Tax=Diaphorobacter sp. ED-3 TaxID=3016636 RepID=UPI0022DCF708|nr:hypothetical protein [Diaphorobacter sp. ED-3]
MKDAAKRLTEEALYEQVASEISSGVRREGLWAKALVQAHGSPEIARAAYIKLRVQSLIDEAELQESVRRAAEVQEQKLSQQREQAAIQARVDEIAKEQRLARNYETDRITHAAGKVVFTFLAVLMVIGLLNVMPQVFQGDMFMAPVAVIYGVVLWWVVRKLRQVPR